MNDRKATQDPEAPDPEVAPGRRAGNPRARTVLLAVLAIGGLVLGYEYRDSIFGGGAGAWLLLLVCVGMHLFMHRGHGHGGGGGAS